MKLVSQDGLSGTDHSRSVVAHDSEEVLALRAKLDVAESERDRAKEQLKRYFTYKGMSLQI